jgi:hypothetical protein
VVADAAIDEDDEGFHATSTRMEVDSGKRSRGRRQAVSRTRQVLPASTLAATGQLLCSVPRSGVLKPTIAAVAKPHSSAIAQTAEPGAMASI